MADAAARREARKRRILENSEERLQKITGQTSADKFPEDASKPLQKSSPPSTFKEAIPNESVIDSWNIHSEFQDEFPSTSQQDLFTTNPLSPPNVPRRRNLGYTPNGDPQGQAHKDDFIPDHQNSFFSCAENPSMEAEKWKDSNLISFLASRWVYVALAVVVNIMIVLRTEHLFGTSIIVPFLVILITRMFFCPNPLQSQNGSMLFAALILCNIRPEIIHRLKTSSRLCFVVLKEFSFYLFSFVIIYYFCTSYWHDFADLAPNKIEIIVDHQTDA
ncbi:uncharacterized protein LOC107044921 [Diachasma alloeum]|uniref:uncharacterized protein LOC107044921 n=1 Tax=Diachasma alloeum TaxID=454923 RepID=UPI0007384538|nr:uncharacterized protein LOC107044921 [Diachasma alloeum]XP_015122483.1 uncharacterized protein LOC107044921 [Diachasma alloeum]XP_015122484.1 uncharacterized protein LOC107044921 [Diachasma alloeum]